jgi:hypothetical protein
MQFLNRILTMNLFAGRINVSTLIPVAVGLLYAGTGGWTDARWTAALAIMGLGPAVKFGYEKGYWTENPELTRMARNRDRRGRFTKEHSEEEEHY